MIRSSNLPSFEIENKLKDLWIEFMRSTSFKSKANNLEDEHLNREIFLLLDLDFFKLQKDAYEYNVSF